MNLYRDNGSVKLEVVDQGIGIPQQEQQKIFEKFYRVGDPLVHNTKGSGLGLSLVRHIVTAHGGEVAVDSAPGQGSKFTIVLPSRCERQRSNRPKKIVSHQSSASTPSDGPTGWLTPDTDDSARRAKLGRKQGLFT